MHGDVVDAHADEIDADAVVTVVIDRQPTLTSTHNRPDHLQRDGSNGAVRDTLDIDGGEGTDTVTVSSKLSSGSRNRSPSPDSGTTWTPVFDGQPVASIGAIAVYQKNPNIVWVGTGESKPRNSVSVGRGVYLSVDADKTSRRCETIE